MLKSIHILAACAALLLTACASKEPLDYLPDSGAYLAVNAKQVRDSEGGRKLAEALEQLQPGGPSIMHDQLQKLYVGIEGGPRDARSGYAVAIGGAGMPQRVLNELKASGGREQKMAGRSVVTSGQLSMTAVGDTGLLLFRDEAALDKMIRTSKKKSPSAAQSTAFGTLRTMSDQHAVTALADAAPLLGFAQMQLQQLSKFDPAGAEALQQVRVISMSADWNTQPVLVANLHLSGEEAAGDLAGLLNMGLSFATTLGGDRIPANLRPMIKSLKAETSTDGVTVKTEIPQAEAEQFLRSLRSR